MITVSRADSENKDFQRLVLELDKELAKRNGGTNDFFAQFNKTNGIAHALVAYKDNLPIGCGAMKKYNNTTMEIKRMYVPLNMRRKGVAAAVLNALENWARELGYNTCVLETGNKMLEAIGLYKKSGYNIIPNYGPYKDIDSSMCFEKTLTP